MGRKRPERRVNKRSCVDCSGWYFFPAVGFFLLKGGDVLMQELHFDEFAEWLLAHEDEPVGFSASCFESPLALWLSEKCGVVCGVDECRYGRALSPFEYWRLLPRWAALFSCWLERLARSSLMGWQAFDLLARVELALWSAAA